MSRSYFFIKSPIGYFGGTRQNRVDGDCIEVTHELVFSRGLLKEIRKHKDKLRGLEADIPKVFMSKSPVVIMPDGSLDFYSSFSDLLKTDRLPDFAVIYDVNYFKISGTPGNPRRN